MDVEQATSQLANLKVLKASESLFTDTEREALEAEISNTKRQLQETFDGQYRQMLARVQQEEERITKRREVLANSEALRENKTLFQLFAAQQAQLEKSLLELVEECENVTRARSQHE